MYRMSKTKVMVLGTIHRMHKDNKFYSYDDVFSIIDRFKPDVIGVEIRREDMMQPRGYLEKYYPYEMIESKFRYEDGCSIYGFDWLGKSIEGKLIPERYFETLDVKILEKEFDLTQDYQKEKDLIEAIEKVRMSLIMNHTAEECNNGRYDTASEIFYSQLELMLENTPYEKMYRFYSERDLHIDNNMIDIIRNNKGKRIIVMTGMDHRVFAIKAIRRYFNDEIDIMEI